MAAYRVTHKHGVKYGSVIMLSVAKIALKAWHKVVGSNNKREKSAQRVNIKRKATASKHQRYGGGVHQSMKAAKIINIENQ